MQQRKTIVPTVLTVAFIVTAALPALMSTTEDVACHAEGCRHDSRSRLAATPPVPGRQLPDRRLTIEEVRERIHPDVFQRIGARAYQIARVGDIRPPGDALAYVKERLAMSDIGDGLATLEIYLTVMDCRSQLVKSTHGPGGIGTPPLGMVDLQAMERKLHECNELFGDAVFMEGNWLTRAAQQGSIEAKLYYTIDTATVLGSPFERLSNPESMMDWKENAATYLHDVAATGNLDAVLRLSDAYDRGLIVQKNREMAYAYALAANRIQPGLSGPIAMRELEEGLSMKQRESAVTLSRQIYSSCCAP